MARLQILELPEGASDDRPPFILVIDQADEQIAAASIAEQIGARAVLAFESTIDIPANNPAPSITFPPLEVTLEGRTLNAEPRQSDVATNTLNGALHARGKYGDQQPRPYAESAQPAGPARCRYCGADSSHLITHDGDDLYTCANCDAWRAKLNAHHAALVDALGMDSTRDWDDIVDAARGLKHSHDRRRATAVSATSSALQRLSLAKDALIATGYFAPSEIGDDIGPRITELLTHLREEREETAAAIRDALGLDNDPSIKLVQAVRATRLQNEQAQAALAAVHALHKPVQHRGRTICAHCSDWDAAAGGTTDSAPVQFPCDTVRALDTKPGTSQPEPAGTGGS